MKKSVWWIGGGAAVILALTAFLLPINKKELVITEALNQFLNYSHYQPLEINDDFSQKVFDMYIERMDLNKRYFFQSDIDKLSAYKLKIDDEWKSRSFELFEKSSELLQERMLNTKKYFEKFLSTPFDLTLDESFETDPDRITFPRNEKDMEESWYKALKIQVVMRVASNIQSQEEAAKKSDSVKIKDTKTLEIEARKGLLDNYNDWYGRIKQMDRDDFWAIFVNSVISIYDPHSWYMPPRDQTRFNERMAGKYEGIGATLRQKDGYLMVVDMFPGSPSWRSKQIEINDLIMRVGQEDKPYVDILDMKMESAVDMIKGPKGTKVRLEIRKRDGSIQEVRLTRDVIIMEESYASSLILKDPLSRKNIGYVYLPQFYLDFQDRNGRKCSDDVAKEIEKLNQADIEGLILDLRNNGGGSLPEAVNLAGLFITKGPVVQVKAKEGPPQVLADNDPQVQYDGPLVVMTNYSSASASEIFAGAIQDYKRGIIVGSPSTWGKGSVQRVADLDAYIPPRMNDVKPLGAISLTIQKFYRINGETTQLKGVIPDIILPDSYEKLDIGEKEEEYALSWDRIQPANYSTWVPSVSAEKLAELSKKRISREEDFKLIGENAVRLKEDSEKTLFTLNLNKYLKEIRERAAGNKKFEKLMKNPTGISIGSVPADFSLLAQDTAKKEIIDRMIEDLGKDIYLEEAVYVMNDLVTKK